MIKLTEISWLAGLLEGEAWFGLHKGRNPRISVGMCDEDIITKVSVMWKVNVYRSRNMWITQINGVYAIQWMMTLYPFLGTRRRNVIADIIKFWKRTIYKAPHGTRSMATCHPNEPSVAFGLCSTCYQRERRSVKLLKLAG